MQFGHLINLLETPYTGPELEGMVFNDKEDEIKYAKQESKEWIPFEHNGILYKIGVQHLNRYFWRFVIFHEEYPVARIDIDQEGLVIDGKYVAQIQMVIQKSSSTYQGLVRGFLSNYLIRKFGTIASDQLQSSRAKHMWRQIYEQNPSKIWVYNAANERLTRISSMKKFEHIAQMNDYDLVYVWKK